MKRRTFIKFAASSLCFPYQYLWANTSTSPRFIFITLRGGMDGLAALVPYGDPHYLSLREDLSIDKSELLTIDNLFGLNPALKNMHALYRSNELSLVPACSTSYRERSHFDAQKLLENGTNNAYASSGWINRLLQSTPTSGLAIGDRIPLIMLGKKPVTNWSPTAFGTPSDSTYDILNRLYEDHPLFSQNLQQAFKAEANADTAQQSKQRNNFPNLCSTTVNMMNQTPGAQAAVLELNGWDSHANQGTTQGKISRLLTSLDKGIATIKSTSGPQWKNTVVVISSEFGRTAASNGAKGTDHGTAGLAIVAGGALSGGQVLGEWPGLSSKSLFEGRDVYPANHLHSLLKPILSQHMGSNSSQLNSFILPNSAHIKPYRLFN